MNRLAVLVTIVMSIVIVACGDDSPAGTIPSASTRPVTTATPAERNSQPPTLGSQNTPSLTPAAQATPPPDATGELPRLRLERAFGGLSFRQMTGMYLAPDGRGRVFVTEQPGRIMVFDGGSSSPRAATYLDISDRVDSSAQEMGLLGLAFPPDFRTSGSFYVNYTTSSGGQRRTVISRFQETGAERDSASAASETILMEVGQPFVNHNGGQLAFGPDGYLYIGFGDGGSARDPMGNGQSLRVLLGKLLRIDVSGGSGNLRYRIPPDNPFVGDAGSARPEIWAYGLRNPWRFSFDAQNERLWLADVGQNAREEVDVIEKGGNYGWRIMEGSQCLEGNTCDRTGLRLPVFDYPTAGGNCSVTGGFVYRGQAIPSLRGAYVYGDYCSGRIWALRYDGTRVTEQAELLDADIQISSFAVDAEGEIYALQYANSGGIFRLSQ